jgi:predicted nucleic acid-binding protein
VTATPADRLFLDSNVIFSAALAEQAPMLRFWRLADIVLLTSDYVLGEVRRNLPLPRHRTLAALLRSIVLVPDPPRPVWRIPPWVSLPEKDRPILAAAIANSATHLITGDSRHFGAYYGRRLNGVLVLPPAQYPPVAVAHV